jgi:hypothetical protein
VRDHFGHVLKAAGKDTSDVFGVCKVFVEHDGEAMDAARAAAEELEHSLRKRASVHAIAAAKAAAGAVAGKAKAVTKATTSGAVRAVFGAAQSVQSAGQNTRQAVTERVGHIARDLRGSKGQMVDRNNSDAVITRDARRSVARVIV